MAPAAGRTADARRQRCRLKIDWLPVAVQNRASQIAYISERNPRAAIILGDAIEAVVGRLADHPNSGRPGRIAGTREFVVPGTPYIIAYRIEPQAVLILRLLHGAQDWPEQV